MGLKSRRCPTLSWLHHLNTWQQSLNLFLFFHAQCSHLNNLALNATCSCLKPGLHTHSLLLFQESWRPWARLTPILLPFSVKSLLLFQLCLNAWTRRWHALMAASTFCVFGAFPSGRFSCAKKRLANKPGRALQMPFFHVWGMLLLLQQLSPSQCSIYQACFENSEEARFAKKMDSWQP